MNQWKLFVGVILCGFFAGSPDAHPSNPVKVAETQRVDHAGRLPLSFEVNQGQTDAQVRFLSRGSGYTLFLTSTEMMVNLHRPSSSLSSSAAMTLRMQLLGANPEPRINGSERLTGQVNYLRTQHSGQWHTGISTYARVHYQQIYPGIDLSYYGNQGQLEFDFIVTPGADPEVIRLRFAGGENAARPTPGIAVNGDLVLRLEGGEVRFRKPRIYQPIDGKRHAVEGRFVLYDEPPPNPQGPGVQVGFALAAYDREQPLIIDPVLTYSSYLGGSGADWGNGIAVDSAGNIYVTGETLSADLPTTNALYPNRGGDSDVFVAKFDPSGSALLYLTYLSGSYNDQGNGIAVDKAGNCYVTGQTWSPDFLTRTGSYPTDLEGDADAFVVKLTPNGRALVYATPLGGSGYDSGYGIAVDRAGNAYVTGETSSADFPTRNALSPVLKEGSDAFVAKLAPNGRALIYATRMGGSGYDVGRGIAVDRAGNAYVTGETSSADFPTRNALSPALKGGSDAFVVKLAPDGMKSVYATFLGGNGFEEGNGIAVDSTGNAYVTGWTWSSDFPTQDALYPHHHGYKDAFVAKFNASGKAVYSTYLGGSKDDVGQSIAVDKAGNAYLVGSTKSSDFPLKDALSANLGGDADAFLVKLDARGTTLVYASYLGGKGFDEGKGIAVDHAGNAYLTGQTRSADFPKSKALYPNLRGGGDAFIVTVAP